MSNLSAAAAYRRRRPCLKHINLKSKIRIYFMVVSSGKDFDQIFLSFRNTNFECASAIPRDMKVIFLKKFYFHT